MTSLTEPPVVTTSSVTTKRVPSGKEKPLLSVISPFSRSAKILGLRIWRATSYPIKMPPIAGEMTISASTFSAFSFSTRALHSCSLHSVSMNTFALCI